MSELKMDSVIGALCKHGSVAPFCDKCEITQLRQQLAEAKALVLEEAAGYQNDIERYHQQLADLAEDDQAKAVRIRELEAQLEAGEAALQVTGRSDFPGYVICAELNGHGATLNQKYYTYPAPVVPEPLLKPAGHIQVGCYCKRGRCMAPVVMGRQTKCLDPNKAAQEQE